MEEVFDEADGILVGWYTTVKATRGNNIRVFIPRSGPDVDEDRTTIKALINRARRPE